MERDDGRSCKDGLLARSSCDFGGGPPPAGAAIESRRQLRHANKYGQPKGPPTRGYGSRSQLNTTEYRIRLHRAFMHAQSEGNRAAKFLVYSTGGKHVGGFGSRMLGIANTMLWSLMAKRVFILEMAPPFSTCFESTNLMRWDKVTYD